MMEKNNQLIEFFWKFIFYVWVYLRAFSTTGLLAVKLRSRLSDKSLDRLVFLFVTTNFLLFEPLKTRMKHENESSLLIEHWIVIFCSGTFQKIFAVFYARIRIHVIVLCSDFLFIIIKNKK